MEEEPDLQPDVDGPDAGVLEGRLEDGGLAGGEVAHVQGLAWSEVGAVQDAVA